MNTAKSVRILQAVAMTVGMAIVLWSTGLPTSLLFAEAASITSSSDTLSNSAPSELSNHTIVFTTPAGMSANQTFEVTFAGAFGLGSVGLGDIDLLVNGVSSTTAGSNGVNTWGVAFTSSSTITFTTGSNTGVASSSEISILIGTNATGGVNQITNPSATTTSYTIDIGKGASTMQDSGQMRVAITDEVTVSASVDTTLTFTVSGVASGTAIPGLPVASTTATDTTSVSLPFGTLTAGQTYTIAQNLAITTNAANGYIVTVETAGDLQSSTGATIDGFANGNDNDIPAAWTAPSGIISNPDTYGHWGVYSTDRASTTRANEFTNDTWIAPTTTPRIVMGSDGPADGITGGVGTSTVAYQTQITSFQEAGDDYTTTLRYVATPTF